MITELRSYRIGGIALFDVITSIIGTIAIMLVARRFHGNTQPVKNYVLAGLILAIPLGIFIHVIFGTKTTLNYRLGLSDKPLV